MLKYNINLMTPILYIILFAIALAFMISYFLKLYTYLPMAIGISLLIFNVWDNYLTIYIIALILILLNFLIKKSEIF